MSDPSTECAWAREAASARIDGELGAVDNLRLDLHQRACSGCFAHVAGIGSVAIALRGAVLEQPAIRIFTPREPHRRRRRVGAAAVGALALAVGGTSFGIAELGVGSRGPAAAAIEAGDAPSARADATQQRLLARLWDAVGPPEGRMEAV
jgi:predicted anti-sigma-YlaC factor YlaD